MSISSGLINRPNQCAAEIVDEMMDEAVRCLAGSAGMLRPIASQSPVDSFSPSAEEMAVSRGVRPE